MFQSLVITLREGVEAALVIGIVLSYLRKTGRANWSPVVWWAVGAAVVASIAGAVVLARLEFNEEAFEGWLLLVGSVFVGSLVYWMWKTGKRMKQEIESKLTEISARPSRAAAAGLFLFVFLMIFREGVETILFLTAVSIRTEQLLMIIGSVIGLALAIGLGIAFFQGTLRVHLGRFFSITTVVLAVVAVQLFITGIHELSEAMVIPSGPRAMAIVGPIVNNDAFFFIFVVALATLLVLGGRAPAAAALPDGAQLTPAERRKLLAEQKRQRFWKLAATATGAVIVLLISAEFFASRAARALSPPEPVEIMNGEVRIPVERLADRNLHRFVVEADGTPVRFIALLDSSETVRVGLDACLICGTQGYYQDRANVICAHCAAAIHPPTIGMEGGCNPIAVPFRVEDGAVILAESDLVEAAQVFR
jgi:FTR1 family protein